MNQARKQSSGYTYLGVLFAVVFIGIALALAAQVWSTRDRRAKEQQLLFVGEQFRNALELYCRGSPAGAPREFPRSLDDLLRDKRYQDTRRYLRQVYRDPFTGKSEWGTVRDPQGNITGVFSLAPGVPLKTGNFGKGVQGAGGESYAAWVFAADRALATGAAPAKPATPLPSGRLGRPLETR